MRPSVSVIVPMFNCARTIERTLASVQAQSYADWELLAVDDASPDGCATLAEAMAARDPRIRVLRNGSNRGIAATCNHGARESRGRYLATLDSDDIWAPTKLAAQVVALEAAGAEHGFAWCPFQRIDAEDRVLYAAPVAPIEGWGFLPLIAFNFVGNGSALLVRREAFEDIGGFMENKGAYSSDDLLILLLLAARWKIAFVPEYLVGYRLVSGSVSSSRLRGCHSYLRVLDIVEERHPETPPRFLRERRAETMAKYACHHLEVGALPEALRWFGAALRADPMLAAFGIRTWLRQKIAVLRERLSGSRRGGVHYLSPENERRALLPLTGIKARQVELARADEARFRAVRGG